MATIYWKATRLGVNGKYNWVDSADWFTSLTFLTTTHVPYDGDTYYPQQKPFESNNGLGGMINGNIYYVDYPVIEEISLNQMRCKHGNITSGVTWEKYQDAYIAAVTVCQNNQ